MAAMATDLPQQPVATSVEPSNMNSGVKVLAESTDLKSIPSEFSFVNEHTGSNSDSIPIIDFSLLTSGNPDQRSKVIQELGKACEEWGFFVVQYILSQFFVYYTVQYYPILYFSVHNKYCMHLYGLILAAGKSRNTGNLNEGNNRQVFGVLRFARGGEAKV